MVKFAKSVTTFDPCCESVVKFGFAIASMSLLTVLAVAESLFTSDSLLAGQAVFVRVLWNSPSALISGVKADWNLLASAVPARLSMADPKLVIELSTVVAALRYVAAACDFVSV